MVFLGPIIAAIKELLEPITQVPKVGAPAEAFSWWQQTLEAANAVARVVLQNPWLAGVVFGGDKTEREGRGVRHLRCSGGR